MESSGQAESKNVPEFEFWATFEGDIAGFTLMQVLVATTVCGILEIWLPETQQCLPFLASLSQSITSSSLSLSAFPKTSSEEEEVCCLYLELGIFYKISENKNISIRLHHSEAEV